MSVCSLYETHGKTCKRLRKKQKTAISLKNSKKPPKIELNYKLSAETKTAEKCVNYKYSLYLPIDNISPQL